MKLSYIMTPNPATLKATATVAEALEFFYSLDVRHLPIVDDDELVGMLSDRDLRGLAMAMTGGDPVQLAAASYLEQPLSEIMHADVVSVKATDSVSDAIDLMVEYRIGALPVVDHGGALVGIISYVDLLKAWRDEL